MKNWLSLYIVSALLMTLISSFAVAQANKIESTAQYDAQLAEKLQADDYGMKSYVLVTLKTGPNDEKITDKKTRSEIFKGHFSNMTKLAEQGLLVLAGPLMESPPKRGMFIFNVSTKEEAMKLVESDPAVKAGIFVYEIDKYYGSAALQLVGDIHKTVQKKAIQ